MKNLIKKTKSFESTCDILGSGIVGLSIVLIIILTYQYIDKSIEKLADYIASILIFDIIAVPFLKYINYRLQWVRIANTEENS